MALPSHSRSVPNGQIQKGVSTAMSFKQSKTFSRRSRKAYFRNKPNFDLLAFARSTEFITIHHISSAHPAPVPGLQAPGQEYETNPKHQPRSPIHQNSSHFNP